MTAAAEGKPPSGRTPAQATDTEIIELYQVVYLADHPLSLDEIADSMPSAFRNAAYMTHQEYLKGQGAAGMADDPVAKSIAWRRWIEHTVTIALQTKHLLARTPDGRPLRGQRRTGQPYMYEANSIRPPYILRRRENDVIEPWSPEYATLGSRHAARAERRRVALSELSKAKKKLEALPNKTAADKSHPVALNVAELAKLIESCETQIRLADQ